MYLEDNLDIPLKKVLNIIQNRTFKTTYFGVDAIKTPLDAWVYQEIICEIKPDFIVEIGNASGGGLLYLAHLCDLLGHGQVIGVDINHSEIAEVVFQHPRIRLYTGDACDSFNNVKESVGVGNKVLIIEDSSHTYENTINVLKTFHGLVSIGSYFIVEDSICRHGLNTGPKLGPYEAINDFLLENKNFRSDRDRESFFITWNPKGYLRRVS